MIVELDLVSHASIAQAFATIRATVGDPDVVVYNAGYLEGRDLPPEKELLEHFPVDMFDTAMHIACRGPFLVSTAHRRGDRWLTLLAVRGQSAFRAPALTPGPSPNNWERGA